PGIAVRSHGRPAPVSLLSMARQSSVTAKDMPGQEPALIGRGSVGSRPALPGHGDACVRPYHVVPPGVRRRHTKGLTRGSTARNIFPEPAMKSESMRRGGRDAPGLFLRSVVLARISPEQLADILDIAEDGIVTVDARQEIVLFNRGAAKLFGYDPDEAVGRPLDLL